MPPVENQPPPLPPPRIHGATGATLDERKGEHALISDKQTPPIPRPRNRQASRSTLDQRNSEIPAMTGYTSPVLNEPQYIDIDEMQTYLEILPALINERETSRPQTGMGNRESWETFKNDEDITQMIKWMRHVSETAHLTESVYGVSLGEELRTFSQRTQNTERCRRLFNLLMMKRSQRLQDYLTKFRSFAEILEKEKKKVKTIGVAGGTTGAVGGAAALVGVALAPVTMGCSLLITAVGVGMGVAAGGMGAHASKKNKKLGDRQIIETLVCDYVYDVSDIERCLEVILSEAEKLQRHDFRRLQQAGALPEALAVAQKLRLITNNINNGRNAVQTGGMSSERLLNAFAKESDEYFKEKGSKKKLRKSTMGRFSGRIQLLAKRLQEELDYLHFVWKCFA
ncbi:uncharacterized protein LOC130904730 [Corythoichthys intestinalis]|uniref:uncharacterized protein LOC130904730 n=1 Tax=Corythoichthys intestinalis TaxID=161448 RepID=UPI0025A4DF92|nr:uncharacterized protein LOC130904730 [Corythoichthys intestinalis]XP_057673665.1 uncharacterized protein LOC130904730 [Corythoichthys intestinalis]XP_057673667.1 uncharacterized protein LOC130904730 [Corythoichthys intestinalis]XP_057673668.1 uncharacterized protein LOC130904730 [Corythoichthys intestinalis]XP_057673669.1 uncharacterized protein LOC130904730 [Corythoichthys intestinalis]XP_057673670.1 uncharacterized protein LOC130904730 [Corythoichthys intestinalis]